MLDRLQLSHDTLASVLEQSPDCIKLVDTNGALRWMNRNGACAMEIDDFAVFNGTPWADFWPGAAGDRIRDAYVSAAAGDAVRFDAFCPTAKGTPRWWNVSIQRIDDVDGVHAGFLATSRDVTAAEDDRQALIVAALELRHRLKNTYAMIGSLMLGLARGDAAREPFAREMVDRLGVLSAAQTLFATDDAPRAIAALIPALVAPFDSPSCAVTVATLPDVRVDQGQANAIALVVGELCVNAAKHGAIAHGGTVDVGASAGDGRISVVWTERAARSIGATRRTGSQGLTLIDRIVRARRGTFEIVWRDDGPTVTLAFPLAIAPA